MKINRRSGIGVVAASVAAFALVLTGCSTGGGTSGGDDASSGGGAAPIDNWITTTPAATGELDNVDWNLILEPTTLDPAMAGNYGESEVVANICENLLTLNPDFSVTDGLASLDVSDDGRTLVLSVNPDATFWNGASVTAEDVVYSLNRNWIDAEMPIWTPYFVNVDSIEQTGPLEVTINMVQADFLFNQILATGAGSVVEKAYSEANPGFGGPSTPPMCSGPYEVASWESGSKLTITRNEDYWKGVTAKTKQITFSFLAGDAVQTRAITGGAIQGIYQPPFSGLGQLDEAGTVYYGQSLNTFYVAPTRKPGLLQDERIRKALFLATNRQAVVDAGFGGAGVASRSMVAQAGYAGIDHEISEGTGGSDAEIEEAKRLVEEAGSPTEEIVLAGSPEISESMVLALQAVAEAGQAIGLNVVYKPVTLGQFYALFLSPEGWVEVNADSLATQNPLAVADPIARYRVFADPMDQENFSGFENAEITAAVKKADTATDDASRAAALSEADSLIWAQMPWIPIVDVASTLYMANGITGAPASGVNWSYPWAADLGAS